MTPDECDGRRAKRTKLTATSLAGKAATGYGRIQVEGVPYLVGKAAAEVMWVTDAVEPEFYKTRAESHASIHASGGGRR